MSSAAMLSKVEERLKEWGFWYVKELEEECGGAPRQSAFCMAAGQDFSHRTYSSNDAVAPEIADTDRLIKALGKFDYQLQKMVKQKYTNNEGDEKTARRMGLSKRRFNDKIYHAKIWIASRIMLQD